METSNNANTTNTNTTPENREEFKAILTEFIADLRTVFPEYSAVIATWWKTVDDPYFANIADVKARKQKWKKYQRNATKFVFEFCKKKLPTVFFALSTRNEAIF